MQTSYELWDTGAGNIVGAFVSEDEALEVVEVLLAAYGADYADELSLSRRDGDERSCVVARGDQLIETAARRRQQVEPVPSPST